MDEIKRTFLRDRLEQYLQEEGIDPKKGFRCMNPACMDEKNNMKYNKRDNLMKCTSCGTSWDIFGLFEAKYGDGWEGKLYNRYGLLSGKGEDGQYDDFIDFLEFAYQNARTSDEYRKAVSKCGLRGHNNSKRALGYVDAFLFDDGQVGPAFVHLTVYDGKGFFARSADFVKSCMRGQVLGAVFDGEHPLIFTADVFSSWIIWEMFGNVSVAINSMDCIEIAVSTCKNMDAFIVYTQSFDSEKIKKITERIAKAGGIPRIIELPSIQETPFDAFVENPGKTYATIQSYFPQHDHSAETIFSMQLVKNLKEAPRPPLSTGFTQLDRCLLGGLNAGLYVLAGVPSIGKSTFMLQLCDQIAQQGHCAFVFSLEMMAIDLIIKSISRYSLTTSQEDDGRIHKEELHLSSADVQVHMNDLGRENASFMLSFLAYKATCEKNVKYFDLSNASDEEKDYSAIETLISAVRANARKSPVVFIDYLQQLKFFDDQFMGNKQAAERQVIDEILKVLRRLSNDLQIPIVVVSTLSRTGYKGSVKMEALKESGGIEYMSDVIIGMEYTNCEKADFDELRERLGQDGDYGKYREVSLRILKNRYGPVSAPIALRYHMAYNYFEEVETP